VDAAADAGGDGSLEAPMQDLEAALELARAGAATFVGLGPGSYSPPAARRRFALVGAEGGNDVTLAGCGAETELVAIEAVAPSGAGDPELQPVLELADGIQGVRLRSLTLRGGRGGLVVSGGAGSQRPIVVEGVAIVDSVRFGISVTGQGALLTANGLRIQGVAAPDGSFGIGAYAHEGGSVWEPPTGRFQVTGLDIEGVDGVSLLLDHASFVVDGGSVTDTRWLGGQTGRGVQVQNRASGRLIGLDIARNEETGVFVHQPEDVSLEGCTVQSTGRVGPAGEELGGDGLGSSRAGDEGEVSTFILRLLGSSFLDNGRAGGIADGIEVHVDQNNLFAGNGLVGKGETFPNAPDIDALMLQGGAYLVYDGAQELAEPAAVLVEDTDVAPLDMQDDAMPMGDGSD
jgi:hypothetical protein